MLRILLVDPQELVRGALARILSSQADLSVSEASGLEAVPAEDRPDVLVVDPYLGGMSGLEFLRRCHQLCPAPTIVLTTTFPPEELRLSLELGARGFVSKRSGTPEELVRAVRLVGAGGSYFCQDVSRALSGQAAPEGGGLSPRLLEVLGLAARGMTTGEIADQLGVSPRTVEKYRGALLARLQARNLVEALDRARSMGWLIF
ncbi:MAG: response regulator transcription factor [Candidatus Eremiobacterota bacterium]